MFSVILSKEIMFLVGWCGVWTCGLIAWNTLVSLLCRCSAMMLVSLRGGLSFMVCRVCVISRARHCISTWKEARATIFHPYWCPHIIWVWAVMHITKLNTNRSRDKNGNCDEMVFCFALLGLSCTIFVSHLTPIWHFNFVLDLLDISPLWNGHICTNPK